MKVLIRVKKGADFITTEAALDRVKRMHGHNIKSIEAIDGEVLEETPVVELPTAPAATEAPTAPAPTDDDGNVEDNTIDADPKRLFGVKIKGVGEATIRDIVAIYSTKEELLAAISNGEEIPVRDDLAQKIADAFA